MTTNNIPDSKQDEAPERVWVELRTQHAFTSRPEPHVETVEYIRASVAAPQGDAALVEQIVEAVWRNVKRYEDGEIWMDTLRAKAQVKKLLNAAASSPAPAAKCVLCAHDWVDSDGTCLVPVPICSDGYHGTRPCGCKCRVTEPLQQEGEQVKSAILKAISGSDQWLFYDRRIGHAQRSDFADQVLLLLGGKASSKGGQNDGRQ